MDTLKKRQDIIKNIIKRFDTPYKLLPTTEEMEQQAVIDDKNGQYMLFITGWEDNHTRIYDTIFHISLKEGKIHIQNDTTEVSVATLLIEQGIPPEDIVLNYIAPYKRKYINLLEPA